MYASGEAFLGGSFWATCDSWLLMTTKWVSQAVHSRTPLRNVDMCNRLGASKVPTGQSVRVVSYLSLVVAGHLER